MSKFWHKQEVQNMDEQVALDLESEIMEALSPNILKENKMLTIKEMVSGGKKVKFQFYRAKELWYVTEDGFEFPVPVADCGDGVFLNEDKAILFMRYIRKHLESIEAGRLLQESKHPQEFIENEI